MQSTAMHPTNNPQSPTNVESLTKREIEVLEWVATGQPNQAIADRLGIELGTVKWHLTNIYGKLSARNRIQALVVAHHFKLLE